jgi:preprotein translocase subunit SecG
MSVVFAILTFILVLVSFFMIVVVLMQKATNDGGMGAALGGGMSESTFGAETDSVLSKATINSAIIFFVLSFALYLGWIYQRKHAAHGGGALPSIAAPASPATGIPAPTVPSTAAAPKPATAPASPKQP